MINFWTFKHKSPKTQVLQLYILTKTNSHTHLYYIKGAK